MNMNEQLILGRAEAMMDRFSETIGEIQLIRFDDPALNNPTRPSDLFDYQAQQEQIRARLPDDFAAIKRGRSSSLGILDRLGSKMTNYAEEQASGRQAPAPQRGMKLS